jgi:hypothetical protein
MYKVVLMTRRSAMNLPPPSTTIYVENFDEFLDFAHGELLHHSVQIFSYGDGW